MPVPYDATQARTTNNCLRRFELVFTNPAFRAYPVFGQFLERDVVVLGRVIDITAHYASVFFHYSSVIFSRGKACLAPALSSIKEHYDQNMSHRENNGG